MQSLAWVNDRHVFGKCLALNGFDMSQRPEFSNWVCSQLGIWLSLTYA